MILHFCHVISKRKTDITLFLFFHMLYWVIINLLIICCFERWILQCSDFWNLLTAGLMICLLDHEKLLSIQFYFSCLVCCLQLIIFWSVQIECLSYMFFWLTQFASFLNCCCLSHFLFFFILLISASAISMRFRASVMGERWCAGGPQQVPHKPPHCHETGSRAARLCGV